MVKYLISACLVGENVRYNGGNCLQEKLKYLIESYQAISFCPEVAGGLSTPRLPAEIVGGQAQDVFNQQAVVLDSSGQDVTQAFINGAYQTLKMVQQNHISHVILKADSPSCGSKLIYDGSFTGKKILGEGMTAILLRQHGIIVMTEDEFMEQLN